MLKKRAAQKLPENQGENTRLSPECEARSSAKTFLDFVVDRVVDKVNLEGLMGDVADTVAMKLASRISMDSLVDGI